MRHRSRYRVLGPWNSRSKKINVTAGKLPELMHGKAQTIPRRDALFLTRRKEGAKVVGWSCFLGANRGGHWRLQPSRKPHLHGVARVGYRPSERNGPKREHLAHGVPQALRRGAATVLDIQRLNWGKRCCGLKLRLKPWKLFHSLGG
jgi:hypothetical protein